MVRRQVLRRATRTLRPAYLVTRVDLRDAAVVVLAATGDLHTVITKDPRTRHEDRLAELAVRIVPVVPALETSLQTSRHPRAERYPVGKRLMLCTGGVYNLGKFCGWLPGRCGRHAVGRELAKTPASKGLCGPCRRR
jgi:hypothetical protein